MNLLDITQADIERLKENKIVFGLMDERDREILRFVGGKNAKVYTGYGFIAFHKDYDFYNGNVYRIRPNYTLPAPTEEQVVQYALESKLPVDQWPEWVRNYPLSEPQIIKYLQASEVPPAQWPEVVKEWARKHDGESIFEAVYKDQTEATRIIVCNKIIDCMSPCHVPHRLRADYGVKEPEVCVWEQHCDSRPWHKDPHGEHWFMPLGEIQRGRFCPVCGKRIEVKV